MADDPVEAVTSGRERHLAAIRTIAARQVTAISWIGVLIGVVVIGAIATYTAPCGCFLTSDNLLTTAQEFSYIAIAALGGAMVIMTRGIDLSVGANMAFTGLIAATLLSRFHMHPVVAVAIGLALGLGAGLLNGLLITVVGMQPFIATLGTMSVFRGIALVYSQGFTLYPPASFTALGQGHLGPIPNPFVILVGLTVVLSVFLSSTALGRHVYAIGGNEDAARLLGIEVERVKVFVYALAGLLGAVGGILLMSFLGSANPGAATGYELDVIAAAVIGGVSLFGGEGTLFGTVLGAALIQEIQNVLLLERVPGYWTTLVVGLVILGAIGVDQIRRRFRSR
jgi:ribose transport system permease protein